MKYIVKIFVITFLIFGTTNSFAQENIVYVNMNTILTKSKVGIFVEKELTKIHEVNLNSFKKVEENLKKDEIDLISKRNVMKAEEFNEKINSLKEKAASYQKERRDKFEAINEKRVKARNEVLKILEPILSNYVENNDISVMLNSTGILIGKKDLDVTSKIIEELDKKLPSIKLN